MVASCNACLVVLLQGALNRAARAQVRLEVVGRIGIAATAFALAILTSALMVSLRASLDARDRPRDVELDGGHQ